MGGVPEGKAADLVTLPAQRSLLRFLHVSGLVTAPLADADEVGFGTKPELARQTIMGAIDAEMPDGAGATARPPSRRRERPC